MIRPDARLLPAASKGTAPERDEQGPRAEPPIQVTIGRVEVRAVMPSAPPVRPRPKIQTLSLDDYLHGRHRDRR